MSRQEQADFICGLSNSIVEEMIKLIHDGHVPADWDGWLLREWLANRMRDQACFGILPRKESKKYKNDVLINNL
jgi:hypothetical protein